MFGFHVVHLRIYNSSLDTLQHRGYEIWLNNKPFIQLRDGLALKRHEAYTLAASLNGA